MFYKDKTTSYFMKTNKLFLVLTGFLLLVSALQLTSACQKNQYNDLNTNDDVIFIIRNVNQDNYDSQYWENEDRYPTYDYRNGYSYRATQEYQEDLNDRIYRNTYVEYNNDYRYGYNSQRVYFQEQPEYFYTYDEYMRRYTAHECYSNPPSNRIIYTKCP